jgi:hypothetical protein
LVSKKSPFGIRVVPIELEIDRQAAPEPLQTVDQCRAVGGFDIPLTHPTTRQVEIGAHQRRTAQRREDAAFRTFLLATACAGFGIFMVSATSIRQISRA